MEMSNINFTFTSTLKTKIMKPSVQEKLEQVGTEEFGNWNMESNSEGIDFDCEFLRDITEEY